MKSDTQNNEEQDERKREFFRLVYENEYEQDIKKLIPNEKLID